MELYSETDYNGNLEIIPFNQTEVDLRGKSLKFYKVDSPNNDVDYVSLYLNDTPDAKTHENDDFITTGATPKRNVIHIGNINKYGNIHGRGGHGNYKINETESNTGKFKCSFYFTNRTCFIYS